MTVPTAVQAPPTVLFRRIAPRSTACPGERDCGVDEVAAKPCLETVTDAVPGGA
ncbi:MAG: hypothetical protein IPN03_15160 [Holophagales bacterium]|nr:hypothetical protein [Holophagales bacterium]